jgi:hypothetical protein
VSSFGEKLKHERESRQTPLADVARRTRIGIEYLEALERGDFGRLPGRRGFGKFYIRVYADLFGFDPEPLISQYERERLEQELPQGPAPRVEPARPRKTRFVPRARKAPTTVAKREPSGSSVEKAVPDPPVEASDPADRSADSPVPATVATVPAPVRSAPSERLAGRDTVSRTGPAEPGASTMKPAGAAKSGGAPSWKRRVAGGTVILLVIGALGVAWSLRAPRRVDPPDPGLPAATAAEGDDLEIGQDAAGPPGARAPSVASKVDHVAAARLDPPPGPTAPALPPPRSTDSTTLDVSEFELGTGVVDRQVVEVRREFAEGEVAWFLTRIRGGAPGQTVSHAWLHEGRLVQNIHLRLGSSNWRTYSKKTLWGTGGWAVEARRENGEVLARVEFRCVPDDG